MRYVPEIIKGSEISMSQKEKSSFKILENHPNDSRVKYREDGTFQTLSSRMGTGGECADGRTKH